MRLGLACLALSAVVIAGAWAWLGAPVPMPQSPLGAGEKLYCISYAPFRGGQTPLDLTTHISAAQIEDDLSRLAKITDCVRTYSVDFGLDQIAGIAARHGLKVMQGLWLSSYPERNRFQIETAVALANRYPGTIRSIVVGNEVLLRGEMSAEDLAATIRAVKARVSVPVTYADVWEFWLRNRDVASAADFITIHILPYWEDFPIPARDAAAHVDSIRRRVVAAFPGKEVIIGEVGLAERGTHARGRAAFAGEPGARHPGCAGVGEARRISASMSSRRSTNRGSARLREPSAAIGVCSTMPRARRNSLGGRRYPTIRCGGGRRPVAFCSR